MRLPEACELLGIDVNASREDAVKQYRLLALKYHPDRCKDEDATSKFQTIGSAWSRILQYHELLCDVETVEQSVCFSDHRSE